MIVPKLPLSHFMGQILWYGVIIRLIGIELTVEMNLRKKFPPSTTLINYNIIVPTKNPKVALYFNRMSQSIMV